MVATALTVAADGVGPSVTVRSVTARKKLSAPRVVVVSLREAEKMPAICTSFAVRRSAGSPE